MKAATASAYRSMSGTPERGFDRPKFGMSRATVLAPGGEPVSLAVGQRAFLPDAPGEYTLVVGEDRYPVSVNVDPSESLPAIAESASRAAAPLTTSPREASSAAARQTAALWPVLAVTSCDTPPSPSWRSRWLTRGSRSATPETG